MTNDTYQTYVSDQTRWYNAATGWDRVTVDGIVSVGFSDTTYLASATGSTTAGPTFASGQSIVFGMYVISLPGTGGGIFVNFGSGNITSGWILGNSTVNSNKFRLLFKGVNSDANIELNLTLTTGYHVIAVANLGTSCRASLDGGTVVATAAMSGSYVAPSGATLFAIGRYFGAGGLACAWMRFGFFQAYGSALSDGDLQTLSGNGANYIPGVISAAPTYDLQARWMRTEGIASGVSAWQIYGTSSSKSSYVSAQGGGIAKVFY